MAGTTILRAVAVPLERRHIAIAQSVPELLVLPWTTDPALALSKKASGNPSRLLEAFSCSVSAYRRNPAYFFVGDEM